MAHTLHGNCLCKAITYTVDSESPVPNTVLCHCKDCQRTTGTTYSLLIIVPRSAFHLTGGTSIYHATGESGQSVERHFCNACGSPVFTAVDVAPDTVFVKAGTLDDELKKQLIAPHIEIFTRSRLPFSTEKVQFLSKETQ